MECLWLLLADYAKKIIIKEVVNIGFFSITVDEPVKQVNKIIFNIFMYALSLT